MMKTGKIHEISRWGKELFFKMVKLVQFNSRVEPDYVWILAVGIWTWGFSTAFSKMWPEDIWGFPQNFLGVCDIKTIFIIIRRYHVLKVWIDICTVDTKVLVTTASILTWIKTPTPKLLLVIVLFTTMHLHLGKKRKNTVSVRPIDEAVTRVINFIESQSTRFLYDEIRALLILTKVWLLSQGKALKRLSGNLN